MGIDPGAVSLPAVYIERIKEFLAQEPRIFHYLPDYGIIIGKIGFVDQVKEDIERTLDDYADGLLVKEMLTFKELVQNGGQFKIIGYKGFGKSAYYRLCFCRCCVRMH